MFTPRYIGSLKECNRPWRKIYRLRPKYFARAHTALRQPAPVPPHVHGFSCLQHFACQAYTFFAMGPTCMQSPARGDASSLLPQRRQMHHHRTIRTGAKKPGHWRDPAVRLGGCVSRSLRPVRLISRPAGCIAIRGSELGLRKHGNRGLRKDLLTHELRHFRGHVHVGDPGTLQTADFRPESSGY